MVSIDEYTQEKQCEYKDEQYIVRDNGAIMRLPKKTGEPRKLDNTWTFGKKNEQNGYMFFFGSNIRIHQVVATAFHGMPQASDMVVDHKDTNRCNNRPENLHWVTKLENALNNPITRQKIIMVCGSIEAFLENPSLLQDNPYEPNFKWMRTVTKDEASACKENLERWAEEDRPSPMWDKPKGITDDVFKRRVQENKSDWDALRQSIGTSYNDERNFSYTNITPVNPFTAPSAQEKKTEQEDKSVYFDSKTLTAKQEYWRTPTEFPLCPAKVTDLKAYYSRLEKGKVFSTNQYGDSAIEDFALSNDDTRLLVSAHNPQSIKKWSLTCVYINEGYYIHQSIQTYFSEEGMLNAFHEEAGIPHDHIDCIDDYC